MKKTYPDANYYDSDYDYYLACKNYNKEEMKQSYLQEADKTIVTCENELLELIEKYKFEIHLYDEVMHKIQELQNLIHEYLPVQQIDL